MATDESEVYVALESDGWWVKLTGGYLEGPYESASEAYERKLLFDEDLSTPEPLE